MVHAPSAAATSKRGANLRRTFSVSTRVARSGIGRSWIAVALELHASGETLPRVPGADERDVRENDADGAEVVDHDLADDVVRPVRVHDARDDPGDEAEKQDRRDRIKR